MTEYGDSYNGYNVVTVAAMPVREEKESMT